MGIRRYFVPWLVKLQWKSLGEERIEVVFQGNRKIWAKVKVARNLSKDDLQNRHGIRVIFEINWRKSGWITKKIQRMVIIIFIALMAQILQNVGCWTWISLFMQNSHSFWFIWFVISFRIVAFLPSYSQEARDPLFSWIRFLLNRCWFPCLSSNLISVSDESPEQAKIKILGEKQSNIRNPSLELILFWTFQII
jgi:hypothetical protein